MNDIERTLLIVCGTLCVAMGVIGMFLPILPTTPFLLLASACYARSSKRFYQWLLTNRCFGEYIRNYREGRGIPLRQKILTLILLWLTIGYALLFVVSFGWITLVLLGIAGGVTVHLVKTRTFKPEARNQAPLQKT
ncbi:MAG: YbaN family protein [Candidatus Eisenbacteria bacterium]|nr:YbaN family protein [Candidatus Eisenbacteria bacterium]